LLDRRADDTRKRRQRGINLMRSHMGHEESGVCDWYKVDS
jgi:hypothetical protein